MFEALNRATVNTFGRKNVVSYDADDFDAPIEVKVIFDKNTLMVDPDTESIFQSTNPMIHIVDSDLPRKPKEGDRITINGKNYKVAEPPREDSEGMSKLELHKVLPNG